MTNPNKTLIDIVLDRSASMGTIKSDMQVALNSFVKDQSVLPGECLITLVQFNHEYEVVFQNRPAHEVEHLELRPDGNTALLDAIGRTITDVGASLANMNEDDRPGIVIVAIISDGEENSSQEYTPEKVREMVQHQQDVYNWQFTFMGANQDAMLTGQSIGVPLAASLTYAASSAGVYAGTRSMSDAVTGTRASGGSQKMGYSEAERRRAADKK